MGAGWPDKGDTSTATGVGPSVATPVATPAVAAVIDEEILYTRLLAELHYRTVEVIVCIVGCAVRFLQPHPKIRKEGLIWDDHFM